MRPDRIAGLVLTILLLSLPLVSAGHAQDTPAVQVDMSVLYSMDPAVAAPVRPGPLNPAGKKSLTSSARANRVSTPPQEAPVATPSTTAVVFPVKIQDRTDVIDPALGVQPTEPLRKRVARQPMNVAPLPELKPVKSAARKPEVKAPLPPKRPDVHQTARASDRTYASDLSKGGMKMPAVPAKAVYAEPLAPLPLPAAASNDELAKQLVVPDRQALAKSIESIADRVEVKNSAPVPAPVTSKIASTVFERKAKAAEPIDITAVEPAAGLQTASLMGVPRLPPEDESNELEYISFAFSPGKAELDEKTLKMLDDEIVPLLRNNPDWRLQIQAFADKAGRDAENARRTSLSRALAVRSHLAGQGIEVQRIDLRALGMQTDRNPRDRIDFVFFGPNSNG